MAEKEKQKSYLQDLFGGVDKALNEMVREEDFVKFSKMLLDTIHKAEARLSQSVAKNKATADSELSTLARELNSLEARVTRAIGDTSSKSSQSLQEAVSQLRSEVRTVMNLIPDYTERFSDIEAMIPTLPEEKIGENFRNELEALPDGEKLAMTAIQDLPETLKGLEDKIVVSNKGGGGVTNMRVIQAFKSILKTEAPVGLINGSNTTYTLSQPIFAILGMTINGETIAQLPNYTISHKTITFSVALPAAYSGKDFEVKYI